MTDVKFVEFENQFVEFNDHQDLFYKYVFYKRPNSSGTSGAEAESGTCNCL